MSFEIIGLHPIPSGEPVHLIEAKVTDYQGLFDIGQVMQPDPALPESNWQSAWRPYLLSVGGDSGEPYYDFEPIEIAGLLRFLFYLHDVNLELPISTPFGMVPLPKESPLPTRLNFAKYAPVD